MMMFWKMWFNGKPKMDFIQCLGPDLSIKILTSLDDRCDLVRVSAVSKSWYRFEIPNLVPHELSSVGSGIAKYMHESGF
ncbi:F-box-like protein [Medicago truncatula]|uniref:F-box-like protein n=1 Tax=Medicago truncatula TaxID=3880 RepID=A0A072TI13_MEDTR|nr:F-box-like protein [Medicago truncatula]